MKTFITILTGCVLPGLATAQIYFTRAAYTQDFNSLESGTIYHYYSTLPDGWLIQSSFNSGRYVWTTVTNGYSNNYGNYCFSSSPDDPDKSLGLVIGTTGTSRLGARLRNDTGRTLHSLSIQLVIKQWTKGAVVSSDQTIPFSYSVNAIDLAIGTWVNDSRLDLHSIHDGDGIYTPLNGNDSANQQTLTATLSGFSWLPNYDLWIRWTGVSHPFYSNHALAIDDVRIVPGPELRISPGAGSLQISWPTNYAGSVLESAITPQEINWDAVATTPTLINGEFVVPFDSSDSQRFYRLRLR